MTNEKCPEGKPGKYIAWSKLAQGSSIRVMTAVHLLHELACSGSVLHSRSTLRP